MGPSSLSSWVQLIARTLRARGINAEEVFRQAKLPPVQSRDPNARYPAGSLQRLWGLAAEATGDPCFGLEVGRAWHPTSFHALGYAALASASLCQALEYLVRYSRVVTSGARLELVEQRGEVVLSLASQLDVDGEALRAPAQAGLAAIAVLCREARGAPVELRRVSFAHRAHEGARRLEDFFDCQVAFGAKQNALVFPLIGLDAPLGTANAVLLGVNEQVLAHYHAHLESSELAERVRSQLLRSLPSGDLRQSSVARSLNLSLRSMQRKLGEEGTSFRDVLDETRRRLAAQYAKDETLSSAETAYLLGFSEASSFSRARRRWRGR